MPRRSGQFCCLGGQLQGLGIGGFVGGTGASGGDQPRSGSQPAGEQQRFGDVLPAQEAAREDPDGRIPASESFIQPGAGMGECGAARRAQRTGEVRQPARGLAEVRAESKAVGPVDGGVMDVRAGDDGERRDLGERTRAGALDLGPALPAIVEPPVMMMRDQGYAMAGARAAQFGGEDEVAGDAEVMRPHDDVGGLTEQSVQAGAEPGAQFRKTELLFGGVPERGIDGELDGDARQGATKRVVPGLVEGFADGEGKVGDRGRACLTRCGAASSITRRMPPGRRW